MNPANVDMMERKMKRLGRKTIIQVADSTLWKSSKKNYLLGGALNIARGKVRALINENSIAKGKCGN